MPHIFNYFYAFVPKLPYSYLINDDSKFHTISIHAAEVYATRSFAYLRSSVACKCCYVAGRQRLSVYKTNQPTLLRTDEFALSSPDSARRGVALCQQTNVPLITHVR